MNNNKENKKFKTEIGDMEDTTKYGEFISSFFAWNTLDGQKEKANKMESMTKKKDETNRDGD